MKPVVSSWTPSIMIKALAIGVRVGVRVRVRVRV
jgi:hypothetical protein